MKISPELFNLICLGLLLGGMFFFLGKQLFQQGRRWLKVQRNLATQKNTPVISKEDSVAPLQRIEQLISKVQVFQQEERELWSELLLENYHYQTVPLLNCQPVPEKVLVERLECYYAAPKEQRELLRAGLMVDTYEVAIKITEIGWSTAKGTESTGILCQGQIAAFPEFTVYFVLDDNQAQNWAVGKILLGQGRLFSFQAKFDLTKAVALPGSYLWLQRVALSPF